MSSKDTVLLQAVLTDGMTNTLPDVIIELIEHRKESKVVYSLSFPTKYERILSNDRVSSFSNLWKILFSVVEMESNAALTDKASVVRPLRRLPVLFHNVLSRRFSWNRNLPSLHSEIHGA